jgi:hypothetical protein
MHADFHAPVIASASLSFSGVALLVSKIVPHLATLAILLQIAVSAVSLWLMLKKKASTNEKTTPSTDNHPPTNGVQPNP